MSVRFLHDSLDLFPSDTFVRMTMGAIGGAISRFLTSADIRRFCPGEINLIDSEKQAAEKD
jgi:hypothetical protein